MQRASEACRSPLGENEFECHLDIQIHTHPHDNLTITYRLALPSRHARNLMRQVGFDRLAKTMPATHLSPGAFRARLEQSLDSLRREWHAALDVYAAGGKNVNAFRKLIPPPKGSGGLDFENQATSNQINVIAPDGTEGYIPAEDWEAAEQEGFKRI